MAKPRISKDEALLDIAIDVEKLRVMFQGWYDKGFNIINPKSFEYEIVALRQRGYLWKRIAKYRKIVKEEAEN